MSDAVKHDQGKPQMEFISSIFLFGMAEALAFGAKKYAAHNWRKGLAYSRCWNSLMRHLWAWWGGEELDPESKLPHLDHAACCIMFLRELSVTHKHLDDRYKIHLCTKTGHCFRDYQKPCQCGAWSNFRKWCDSEKGHV